MGSPCGLIDLLDESGKKLVNYALAIFDVFFPSFILLHHDYLILQVFERYLTFCGIGIQNAQLFEVSILEYKKNQVKPIHNRTQSIFRFVRLRGNKSWF